MHRPVGPHQAAVTSLGGTQGGATASGEASQSPAFLGDSEGCRESGGGVPIHRVTSSCFPLLRIPLSFASR